MTTIDLNGRKAIVTGGARGIGRAIAQRLLQSGASVTLWDRDGPALEQTRAELSALGTVHVDTVDITHPDAVGKAALAAHGAMGGIDILINNAGISGPHVPAWEYGFDDWNEVLKVNLTGPFLCCKAVIPLMLKAGYGRIVSVASIAGKEGAPLISGYSASKAGLIALTKSLGKELADTGILVNCITPGPTRTDMIAGTPEAQVKAMLSRSPMKRLIEPKEVAALVTWLASDECSFATGAVHDLSGGRATY